MGNFGDVYKGKIDGVENEVAIKTTMTLINYVHDYDLKSILSEIKVMTRVGSHPNVVSIIGAYTEEIKKGIFIKKL